MKGRRREAAGSHWFYFSVPPIKEEFVLFLQSQKSNRKLHHILSLDFHKVGLRGNNRARKRQPIGWNCSVKTTFRVEVQSDGGQVPGRQGPGLGLGLH